MKTFTSAENRFNNDFQPVVKLLHRLKKFSTKRFIGSSGTQSLSESLKFNSTLTTLYLSGNNFGDEGTQSISESLKFNSTLTTLNLYGNYIGSSGTQSISESLKFNSNLTTLHLWGNNIGSMYVG